MPKQKTQISLKPSLLNRIDAIAKMSKKSRDAFINEFFEDYLDKAVEDLALDKEAIKLYMANKIDETQLALIVGKEKTEAAKISKRIGASSDRFLKTLQ